MNQVVNMYSKSCWCYHPSHYAAIEYYKACNVARETLFAALLLACGPPPDSDTVAFQEWCNAAHIWLLELEPKGVSAGAVARYHITCDFRHWFKQGGKDTQHDLGKS